MRLNKSAVSVFALLTLLLSDRATADMHTLYGNSTCPAVGTTTSTLLYAGTAASTILGTTASGTAGGVICLPPTGTFTPVAGGHSSTDYALADVTTNGASLSNIPCAVCHYASPSMALPALSLGGTMLLIAGLIFGVVYRGRWRVERSA